MFLLFYLLNNFDCKLLYFAYFLQFNSIIISQYFNLQVSKIYDMSFDQHGPCDGYHGYDLESLIQSCFYEGGEEQAQAAEGQNKGATREPSRQSQKMAGSNQQIQIVRKSSSQSEEESFQIGQTYPQNVWQTSRGHWANTNETIN